MNEKKWSFARQQKYDFCRRAFYFKYISKSTAENFSQAYESYQLKSFAFNTLFYDRSLSLSSFTPQFYKESCKYNLPSESVEQIRNETTVFLQSEFYLTTSPALVFHNQPPAYNTASIEDVDILGSIDFVWTEKNGSVNIVTISERSIHFAMLYGLRKLGVSPDRLNTGTLKQNFNIVWYDIDWNRIQEIQDQALSFNFSNDINDFPLTDYKNNCHSCHYYNECSDIKPQTSSQLVTI